MPIATPSAAERARKLVQTTERSLAHNILEIAKEDVRRIDEAVDEVHPALGAWQELAFGSVSQILHHAYREVFELLESLQGEVQSVGRKPE